MKALLVLSLLLVPLVQEQQPVANDEAAPLTILSSKWMRDRQPTENLVSALVGPQPAMNSANKNYERQKRANALPGDRDPNLDAVDTRGSELERINQEARDSENRPMSEGYAYQVKVQNGGAKVTQNIFWEYQFREQSNPTNLVRRQFVCSVKIKPSDNKSLQAFSTAGPSDVVDVKSLSSKSGFREAVIINRVEYADGTFWQRKDWQVSDLKLNVKARAETHNLPMCRSL